MTTHPYYQHAVLFLAEIHSTTPEIIHNSVHDTEHDYGLQLARELNVVLNYTEVIAGWREKVLASNGGMCCWPGCVRVATDAHHLEGKQAHPELRHVIANGRGLCRYCHDYAHCYPAQARVALAQNR